MLESSNTFDGNVISNCILNVYSNKILKRLKHSLFARYRDLQALVYKQETGNLTLHSAAPSLVLNFLLANLCL